MNFHKKLIIVRLQWLVGLFGLFIATETMTMNLPLTRTLSPIQKRMIAARYHVMSQQQLFAQKDELQNWVKEAWESCLKALKIEFPAFVVEQTLDDEHIIEVKWDFERLLKSDDKIFFIRKTVQGVMGGVPIFFVKVGQQREEQGLKLKEMLERMIINVFTELILKDISKPLDWCTCTAEYKRITLALLLINEIREKFPNKNDRIVYTSFASGSLLQDYVVLSELLLSHTNFLVNFIDLEYPDIPALIKKDLSTEYPRDLHMLEMKNKQETANMIDSFKIKMAQVMSERGLDYNFDVDIYQNIYQYIASAQKNTDEKSNIMILVDPSVGSFGMANFPSLANVINVWIDQEKVPVFTIYLPRHHGAHLYQYQTTEIAGFGENTSSKIIESLRAQLLNLIESTGINKNYTSKFVNELLEKSIDFDKQITDEDLAKIFPQLMEIRQELKEGDVQYEALEVEALEVEAQSEELAEDIEAIQDNLMQELTPVQLGDVSVLLSWGTDAHISFQDLVWDALAKKAIVYQLYATDPIKLDDETKQIIKVNPEVYKKVDVITPNSGKESEKKYKRIL